MNKPLVIFFGLIAAIFLLPGQPAMAQGADTRVCECFTAPVPNDFLGTTVIHYPHATRGLVLDQHRDFTPPVNVPVNWMMPRLQLRSNCGAVYRIAVLDSLSGAVLYESEDSAPKFSYTFTECGRIYEVRLSATAKPVAGSGGNCTRQIRYGVRPQCNTAACACGGGAGISPDINLNGKLLCLPSSTTRRRYTLQYRVVNKTACSLKVESLTVLGESLGSGGPDIPARGSSPSYNNGFSTPLATPPPSGAKVSVQVRYSLNGRKCSATLDMPYEACR